uniref:Tripartite motif containing 39 n=1 Tax=Terrapene triunguis TaxID=2587831 RepID=A0A674JY02_9SAUR
MLSGSMATVEKLQEEASCSICLEYFQDPVSIHCGHNFCRACITQCWGELATNFSCPQCRQTAQQRNFRLNRELANMVELVKQLKLPPTKEPEAERVCEKHREPLKLFCEEEQQLICLVCRESWAHGAHAVVPIEEAFWCPQFRKDVDKLERVQRREKIKKERQRIGFEFQQLRQFLEEQERLLLARLEELDRIMKWQKETVTRFPMEISHLNSLISELEGKCQQPASDFLQVNFLSVEIGSSSGQLQEPFPVARAFPHFLREKVPSFDRAKLSNVTLDPDTAHPQLVLSADGKGVRRGHEQQDLPDNPERFDSVLSVLGRDGFASGRHYWEVEVGVGGIWSVGVARESVRRKGRMSNYPEQEIWAVGHWGGQYRAYTACETILPLPTIPRRIRVALDYEGGRVAFFDVDNKFLIFIFPPASFTGERLFPFFLAGSPLRLCP